MSKNQISICYLTKKQNAIAGLAGVLRAAFPKVTATQASGLDDLCCIKELDVIIADPDFRSVKTQVPVLQIVPDAIAAEYLKEHHDFITESELYTLGAIRAIKGLLERKKLADELKDASVRDELTGSYNQRFLLETLGREMKKAVRYGYPLTVLCVGVDALRKINAKYGHETGDKVLVDLGLILRNAIREVDTVGRFSGDEFLIILPETSESKAARVTERIQNAVNNFAFANGEGGLSITVGIGTAELSSTIRTKEELLNCVRQALAGAKKRGAGSICSFEEARMIDEPAKENRDLIAAVERQINILTDETKKNHFSGILKVFQEMPMFKKILPHSEHVAFYSERLANRLGLPHEEQTIIRNSAMLHDIGKLVIDERIVMKGSVLSSTEFAIIRQHPVFAAQMLSGSAFIKNEVNTILHHHEHFDGGGYPDHMQGTYIPLPARIIALAEAWDTMITPQVYRPALPLDKALGELKKGAGRQFDPELVAVFTGLIEN